MPWIGWENGIFIGIHFISDVNHFKWHILAVSLEKCCSLAEKEASTLGHTAHYQIFGLSFTVLTLTGLPATTRDELGFLKRACDQAGEGLTQK